MLFFTDSSFDPGSKSGVAGFMMVEETGLEAAVLAPPEIALTTFQNTSCTRLEIESVLIVLQKIEALKLSGRSEVYTDCKTIIELPGRRLKLEAGDYVGKASGKILNNADLYRVFFHLQDHLRPNFVWVKGHKAPDLRNSRDHLFAAVDRATRRTMREIIG